MTDALTGRRLFAAGATALGVGLAALAAAAGTGTSPGTAAAVGTMTGLFALIVAPLAVLARRVGARTDDPEEIERRIAAGLGLSKAEFDAAFGWDEAGCRNREPDRQPRESRPCPRPRRRSPRRPDDPSDPDDRDDYDYDND